MTEVRATVNKNLPMWTGTTGWIKVMDGKPILDLTHILTSDSGRALAVSLGEVDIHS